LEQLIKITLFGQTFRLNTDLDSIKAQEVVDSLVREVNLVQKHYKKDSQQITSIAMLILAALNVVKENLEIKKNNKDAFRELQNRSANIIHFLDSIVS